MARYDIGGGTDNILGGGPLCLVEHASYFFAGKRGVILGDGPIYWGGSGPQ